MSRELAEIVPIGQAGRRSKRRPPTRGRSKSMWALRLMVRVSPNKRQELTQALNSFIAERDERPFRRFIMQDVSDENLICWIGDWRSQESRERFLSSETYRALKGAGQVLGTLEEVQLVESRSIPFSNGGGEREH